MKYPVVLVIPALMLCDYYLTLIGAILHERGYGSHMKVEQYELNPMWQSSVNRRRWFNPGHLATVAFATVVMLLIGQMSTEETVWPVEMLISAVIVIFAAIVGRHLCNILMFRYVIKHPDGLRGEVFFSHQAMLKISQYHVLAALCPVAAMLLFTRESYMVGGVVGLGAFILSHRQWRKKHDKRQDRGGEDLKTQSDVKTDDD